MRGRRVTPGRAAVGASDQGRRGLRHAVRLPWRLSSSVCPMERESWPDDFLTAVLASAGVLGVGQVLQFKYAPEEPPWGFYETASFVGFGVVWGIFALLRLVAYLKGD